MVNPVGYLLHFVVSGSVFGCYYIRGFGSSWFVEFFLDFNELFIKLIKIDIRKYRRTYTSLRCSAVCVMVSPILHITRFKKLSDNVQKFTILDFL